MKIKNIKPSEIITTRDFPVHREQILKIYFKVCKEGQQRILPPTFVIPLSMGLPLLKGNSKKIREYNKKISKYLDKNKKIKYFMCDGNHKTTALTLAHKPIHSIILKSDKDIKEIRKLIKTGDVFSLSTGDSIKSILAEKADHLKDADFFETIEDKTKRMVKEKVIPQFMIDFYKRGLRKK